MTTVRTCDDIRDALEAYFYSLMPYRTEAETGAPVPTVNEDAWHDMCRVKAEGILELTKDETGMMLMVESFERAAIDRAAQRSRRTVIAPGSPF